jgi:hypothetical protein
VGTLEDIDDLLPATASLFDVAIVDEAASVAQNDAVGALVRASRVVVVGDPRQLRHRSPVSAGVLDQIVADELTTSDVILETRLDVVNNSVLDVALSAAPVTMLREHFRSRPHLIDFAAQRLYDGVMTVATRSPCNDALDCISLIRCSHDAVIATVMAELSALRVAGQRSVGVVTIDPSVAQLIESVVLSAMGYGDLEALNLRVGSYDAFVGNERDVMLVVIDGSPAQIAAISNDRAALSVLLTRARQQMVVVLAQPVPPHCLLDEFISRVDTPPQPPTSQVASRWVTAVARSLDALGVSCTTAYVVGDHCLDVVIRHEWRALCVECEPHVDGPRTHRERRELLELIGWEVSDAFASRCGGDAGAAAQSIVKSFGLGHRPPGVSGPSR